jgi:hypothetical protein
MQIWNQIFEEHMGKTKLYFLHGKRLFIKKRQEQQETRPSATNHKFLRSNTRSSDGEEDEKVGFKEKEKEGDDREENFVDFWASKHKCEILHSKS